MKRISHIGLLAILAALLATTWTAPVDAQSRRAPETKPTTAPALEADSRYERIVLEWSRIADAREYLVFRTSNGTFPSTPLARVQGRTFRDWNVRNGVTYSYRVAAANRGGTGPASNVARGLVLDEPTGLTGTPGDQAASLKWLASRGATEYIVYRGRQGSYDDLTEIGRTAALTFADTGLTNGKTYYYRVRARTEGAQSRLSRVAAVKPKAPPAPAPSTAPADLTGALVSGKIKLSWSAVPGATGYKIYRSTTSTFTGTPIGSTSALTFTDVNVVAGTTYRYKVAAYNGTGVGPQSAPLTVAPAPAPIAAPTVTVGFAAGKVTLSWTTVSGATGYRVFRSLSDAFSTTPLGSTSSLTYTDAAITLGTTYFYRVAAYNASGNGPASTTVSITPAAPPVAPTGLSATAGDAMATLSWTPASGANSYNVYRGTATNAQAAVPIATGVLTTAFVDAPLVNGTSYFYKVTAVGAGGEGPRSTEASGTPVAPPPAADATVTEAFQLLRQATWGPRPGDVDAVRAMGRDAFLAQQFGAPISQYPDTLFSQSLEHAQEHFMSLALGGPDQLRQRVAWALHKIWVVSGVEVQDVRAIVAYHRLFLNGAFGNYRDLMEQVTLNPAMGRYLNMLNSRRQTLPTDPLPNENYARELMQLFTLGLVRLNPNGTTMVDGAGNPLPTYTEADVKALARILTGWVSGDGNPATTPTSAPGTPNWLVPMEPLASRHDVTDKGFFLGTPFGPGITARVELGNALDVIFNHPNLAPFVSRQLIQQLVTSNPSPAYIAAVAAVFENNGAGIRGDLAAVVRAILTHPSASSTTTMNGKLSEPVLFIASTMRAFNATVTTHPFMTDRAEAMGQRVFFPPSVFSYFSPGFRVQGTNNGSGAPLVGPEFQGLTSVTALERANFVADLLANRFSSEVTSIDYSPFTSRAGDPGALVDYCSLTFMGGRMSPEQRARIVSVLTLTTNTTERVRTAIYLTLASAQAQVDR